MAYTSLAAAHKPQYSPANRSTRPQPQRMTLAAAALPAASMPPTPEARPLFRFGLLSDVQHADKEDGESFHGEAYRNGDNVQSLNPTTCQLPLNNSQRCRRHRTLRLDDNQLNTASPPRAPAGTPRFYRYALQQLDKAIDAMKAADCTFVIHLGDLVDFHNSQLGHCEETGLHHSEKALREALRHFDRLGRPTLHLLGKHAGERPVLGCCRAVVSGVLRVTIVRRQLRIPPNHTV